MCAHERICSYFYKLCAEMSKVTFNIMDIRGKITIEQLALYDLITLCIGDSRRNFHLAVINENSRKSAITDIMHSLIRRQRHLTRK